MTKISIDLIKALRSESGAGVMDCRRALQDNDGDLERARGALRESGLQKAAGRASRDTGEGLVHAYIHPNRPLGALVKLACETDFVARTDEFKVLANEIAMHIAALDPTRITGDEEGDGEALLEQSYVRDPSRTVDELIRESIARTGENIRVAEFARFEV